MPIWVQLAMTAGGLVWVAVTGLLGWIAKEQWAMVKATQAEVQATKADLAKHREEVAKEYVPRVDYKTDINRVFDKLDEIKTKLDDKEDRRRDQRQ